MVCIFPELSQAFLDLLETYKSQEAKASQPRHGELPGVLTLSSRAGLHVGSMIVLEGDPHWMTVVVILQCAIAVVSATPLLDTDAKSHRNLQLVHALFGLVFVNCAPHV